MRREETFFQIVTQGVLSQTLVCRRDGLNEITQMTYSYHLMKSNWLLN